MANPVASISRVDISFASTCVGCAGLRKLTKVGNDWEQYINTKLVMRASAEASKVRLESDAVVLMEDGIELRPKTEI